MITDNTLNELYQRQAYLKEENDKITKHLNKCDPSMYHVYSRSLSSNEVFLATINNHIKRYEDMTMIPITNVDVVDLRCGKTELWSMARVLHYINKDHNDEWIDYNQTDWLEGWDNWVEGNSSWSRFPL